jgi:hypothetical protein
VRTQPLVTSHNHCKQPLSKEKVDNNEQITSIQAKAIGKTFSSKKTRRK